MKKPIFLILACFVTFLATAQFSFGVKAGINANKLAGSSEYIYVPTDYNLGFHVGVFTNFKFSKSLSLTPELQYIRKGESNYSTHLNYIEIPVLLEIELVNNFSLQVGPSLGQKIWTYKGPYSPGISFSTYDTDLDLGLNGGIKFKVNEKISVLGRYSHGLLPYQRPYSGPNIYTRSIQLSLAYRIK